MKTLLTLLLICFTTVVSRATVATATSSGDWSEAAIWSPGVPGCYDTIVIPAGIQVDITSTVDLDACPDSIFLFIYGHLEFQNGKKLKLPCLSDVIVFNGGFMGVGSGGGSSTYLDMCGTEYWNAASGNLAGPVLLCDGACPPSQLPIELLSFTASLRANERVVDLNWTTLSEADNDYFTVERSADGYSWEAISMVDGAGTSSIKLNYYDVDPNPQLGVSYYRLKQTDFNGHYTYSPIVNISLFVEDQILVYPNPAEKGTTINVQYVIVSFPEGFSGETDVLIYSVDGKVVYKDRVNVTETKQSLIKLDGSFAAGFYTIQTKFANTKLVVK